MAFLHSCALHVRRGDRHCVCYAGYWGLGHLCYIYRRNQLNAWTKQTPKKYTSQTLNESISGENLINWSNRWFSAIRDPGKRLFNMTSSVFINSIIMNCNSKLANGIFTQFSSELGQHDFLGENLIYTYVYVYAEHPRVLFFFLAEVSFHFLSGYMLRWSLPNYFYQGVFNQIIIDITCMLWYYAMALYNPYVL